MHCFIKNLSDKKNGGKMVIYILFNIIDSLAYKIRNDDTIYLTNQTIHL